MRRRSHLAVTLASMAALLALVVAGPLGSYSALAHQEPGLASSALAVTHRSMSTRLLQLAVDGNCTLVATVTNTASPTATTTSTGTNTPMPTSTNSPAPTGTANRHQHGIVDCHSQQYRFANPYQLCHGLVDSDHHGY